MRNLMSAPPTDRVGRYPKHTFAVAQKSFTLQPVMIARVLPGETLTNFYMEARSVQRGLTSPIVGHKQSFFLFYVKATDIAFDQFRDMFVDDTNAKLEDTTAFERVDTLPYAYTGVGAFNWVNLSMNYITKHWFRDEEDAVGSFINADFAPRVQIRENTWMDSLTSQANMPEGATIASATDMADLERLMNAFEQLRMMGVADMTYEEWLRSNGIAIPEKDENKPEMLFAWSDFQYPVNTIDPATGTPVSAASWVWKKSEKTRKFFREPGFLVMVMVTRPKVYFGNLTGALAGWASRASDWAPNYLAGHPEMTLRQFNALTGPVPVATTAGGYFVDMRDDLIHGDQFRYVNGSTDFGNHVLALPEADLDWKYPTEAMCDAIGGKVACDGFASLNIKGLQVDYTVGNFAQEG